MEITTSTAMLMEPDDAPLFDEEYYAELDAREGEVEDFDGFPSAEDEDQAARLLHAYAYWEQQESLFEERAQREIDKAKAWLERKRRACAGARGRLSMGLQRFLEDSGARKAEFPHGTVRFEKARESVAISDEAAFCEEHGAESPFVRLKLSPDKTAIKKHAKETGELPALCDIERGPDVFRIKTKEM